MGEPSCTQRQTDQGQPTSPPHPSLLQAPLTGTARDLARPACGLGVDFVRQLLPGLAEAPPYIHRGIWL